VETVADPNAKAPLPVEDEPYRAAWFYDNPSIGRALRYTFGDKRLARAVFTNALLLVVTLAAVQEAFGRGQLGLFSERISYGRIAFLGLVTVEAVILSILTPLGFVNMFEAERREECFDQVVASGASPHRVVFGRFLATLAFLAVVLFSSLPFFATMIVLEGASVGQVAVAYAALSFYTLGLAAIAAACAVGFDDTALPVIIGILAVAMTLALGFSRRAPPTFAAWSPVRHVVLAMNDVALDLRIGAFAAPEPYGLDIPCAALGIAMYLAFTLIGLAYAFVGPDIELSQGLDSFDSVSISRSSEATRARRGVARTLLRAVQLRFFYENLGPRAQAVAPFLRAAATVGIFTGAHVVFLGALWPATPPRSFGEIDGRLVFPYLGFCGVTVCLLALAGGGARASLLARTPVLRLGRLAIDRFVALFLIIAFAIAVPALLWTTASSLSGWSLEVMLAPETRGLYLLCAGYAAFVFSLALLLAMVTTNPYSATGWALIALFATNLTPVIWVPLFQGNVAGEGSAFLIDLSPFVAGYSVARPGDTWDFSAFQGDELVRYTHTPSWRPFATFHGVVGLACLCAGIVLSRREKARALEARTAPAEPVAKEKA
jgi:hypothetical protein